MTVAHVASVGARRMSRGIVETAGGRGGQVTGMAPLGDRRAVAASHIEKSVEKGIRRGKVSAESPQDVLERIQWVAELDAAADAEFVIEAATEREAVKTDIFRNLDVLCAPGVILASNTSSISITRLAAATKRP